MPRLRSYPPRQRTSIMLAAWLMALTLQPAAVAEPLSGPAAPHGADPHHTPAGFFDIHVCSWPQRPLFFMTVFSTTRFAELARVEIDAPDGQPLTVLDTAQYRTIKVRGKPEKRVFIRHIDLPAQAPDGWYTARITLRDGTRYTARDYVVVRAMEQAGGQQPPDGAVQAHAPTELSWRPVAGASHYRVIIRDAWGDGRVSYESPLVTVPRHTLPPGIVKPGGLYTWRVHARDVNGHVLLGDFNHGSLSAEINLDVAEAE